jgi:hypothetical protein
MKIEYLFQKRGSMKFNQIIKRVFRKKFKKHRPNKFESRNRHLLAFFTFIVLIFFLSFVIGAGYKNESLTEELVNLQKKVQKQEEYVGLLQDELGLKDQSLSLKDKTIDNQKGQLSSKEQILQGREKDLVACKQSLNAQTGKYQSCEVKQTEIQREVVVLEKQVNVCEETTQEVTGVLAEYVRAVCCSYSNVHYSSSKLNWDVEDGEIICERGPFVVDCESGETWN